ncbi:hypothetical protein [Ilumatobacter nonamiensis]|uniref:hypothetical protein n=1 Tax=Ilumatobacter nonamiensis TaxID=467093 RepID=UPI000345C327|nr:hypothetical protein [Ilumatobacter nonamiensis]
METEHPIPPTAVDRTSSGHLSRRSRSALAIATSSLVVLAGCGDDSPTPSVAAVTLEMSDFSIAMPDRIPSGLIEVDGLNDGDIIHQAVIAELPDGVSSAEYVESYLDNAALALTDADLRGGVQLVPPASEQTATVELDPGDYVVFCSLPGPEAGESHLTKGMWTDLTVDGSTSDGPSRIPDLGVDDTIELIDFAFGVPDTVRSGDVYNVVNTGTQVHEIGMAALDDGATRDDVLAFFTGQGPEGEGPPFRDLSGVGLLSPGQAQTFSMDVPPGRYVFVCYVPSPDDGVPHFLKGMIQVVDVV